jgi:hypothetical protein
LICCDAAGVFEIDLVDGRLVRRISALCGPVQMVPYSGYVKFWSPKNDELATFDKGRSEVRAALSDFDLDFATDEQSRPVWPPGGLGPADELWHTRLPRGACAKAWFDGGRALLVTYPFAGRHRLRIEVWRSAQ